MMSEMTHPAQILSGKRALVTGASSGIGRATALALAHAGADVALNFVTLAEAAASARDAILDLGRRAILCEVDISDPLAVEQMVDQVVETFGGIDIFVSSAVYSDREPFLTANLDNFRKTLEVSMMGSFHAMRASARKMVEQGDGGSIVIVSSPHAHNPVPGCMAYNMAKAAQDQMARTAAIELAEDRIRVNLVHPGWIDTLGERKYFSEEQLRESSKALPMGRLGKPEEIARGIVWLCDPASEYVTGSTLQIDGGGNLPWWSKRGKGGF